MVPSIHHQDPPRLTIPSTCLETTVHFEAGPSEILVKLKMVGANEILNEEKTTRKISSTIDISTQHKPAISRRAVTGLKVQELSRPRLILSTAMSPV